MSVFVKHEPCPKCGLIQDRSGNNLGVYSDGHKWCFACSYFVPGNGTISLVDIRQSRILQLQEEIKENPNGTLTDLPRDSTCIIPSSAIEWLENYEISMDEVQKNKIMWSPVYQRLLFPVFNSDGSVMMWQGRYFPDKATGYVDIKKPRFLTRGTPAVIDAYFGHMESGHSCVVVVEDFISAIKVSRVCPALCLWGSELSMQRLRRIALSYPNLYIWMDQDKAHYAAKCVIKARPYFDRVTGVFTTRDPKEYTTEEIRRWLWPAS